MHTKNAKLKTAIGVCLTIFLLLSGCVTQQKNGSIQNGMQPNGGQYETAKLDVPIYPDANEIVYMPDDKLWTDFNVSSSLNRKAYTSMSSVQEIYEWYLNNIAGWEIVEKSVFENPQTSEKEFVYIKLKNNTKGVFLAIMGVNEDMLMKGQSILAIAQGSWSLIELCGSSMEMSFNVPEGEEQSEEEIDLGMEGSITFTVSPIDESYITFVEPLGNLNPGGGHTFPSDHGALSFDGIKDVRAPAEGIITMIQWRGSSDYKVVITHTNTFKSYLDHLSELDESILQQVGNLEEFNYVHIPVKAGEIIGKAGKELNAVDWGVIDENVTLNFIHPERYGDMAHAVHFIPYCEDNLKSLLLSKLQRTAEPRWGKIDFDEPGKLVGNWFLENISGRDPLAEWKKHLSFVYDMWNPEKIRIGVGGTLAIPATLYQVYGNTPDPADISVESGPIVYKLQGTEEFGETSLKATILVEMIDNETIKVEGFTGWVSNPTFTENAKYYIR